MNWNYLLVYVVATYIINFVLIAYSLYDLKKTGALKGDYKEDSKYVYVFALFLAFSPVTIWFFTYTLIKDYIKKKWEAI